MVFDFRKETPLKPAVASKPSLKGGGKPGKGEEASKEVQQQQQGEGGKVTASESSRGSSSRSSSVANEPETRLRGRIGGGQVDELGSRIDQVH